MQELKALDAKGDCLLEMPTGTGKTVTLLSFITSYQLAHPETGKLIYCTRTVPEMTKVRAERADDSLEIPGWSISPLAARLAEGVLAQAVEELKRVVAYRHEELRKDAVASGSDDTAAEATAAAADLLGICLSSRRNMCVHPRVMSNESDRERVDAQCRSMTAQWVRSRAEADPSVRLCEFFENYDRLGTDADLRGIYTLDDLKAAGQEHGWCPYFLARHAISFANVVVYNYQYMLDPKIANLVSRELEDKSIVVFGESLVQCSPRVPLRRKRGPPTCPLGSPAFCPASQPCTDEAHNIDNVCIEALSVTLDRGTLEGAARNLGRLAAEVKRLKGTNVQRLQDDDSVSRPAQAAAASAAGPAAAAGGEDLPAAPVLPTELAEQAIPGNIRNAELFVRFMRHVVRFLKDRIKVAHVDSETPASFLHRMGTTLSVDPKPLRFAYSRLNSLLRTLEVTEVDEFAPISLVADFATLLATYPKGFMVVLEPFNSRTPHIPDPIMQLACLGESGSGPGDLRLLRPRFPMRRKRPLQRRSFQSVILTSGTLSPLDMYPKILNFHPVVRASFEMSLTRPCILPLVVSRGRDQTPLSTKFETRDDQNVMRNYGDLVVQMASTVPDGMVVFFPSYSYMETIITAWHEWGVLERVEAHKLLFIETKDIVATTLSLGSFRRACDSGRGAVFFSIARGKVAEGIDFDRHYGRAVVLVGVPFQYTLSHVLRARLAFMRDHYHIREQDFLTFDALRNSAQCVGRVIRSKRDYGVMVFGDMRYARQDKRTKLPLWVQQAMRPAHLALTPELAASVTARFLREMAQPEDAEAAVGTSLLRLEHVKSLEAARLADEATAEKGVAVGGGAAGSAADAIREALAGGFAAEGDRAKPGSSDPEHAAAAATAEAMAAVSYPPRGAAGATGIGATQHAADVAAGEDVEDDPGVLSDEEALAAQAEAEAEGLEASSRKRPAPEGGRGLSAPKRAKAAAEP
ncbi:XPD [Symbiodinium sp. KB8]|nr:XPD [Symbiodinium sp. KB8]